MEKFSNLSEALAPVAQDREAVESPGRPRRGWRFERLLEYTFLSLFLLLLLFPLVYLLSSSFKEVRNIFEYPFRLVSDTFTFNNYAKAWSSAIKDYVFNSLIIAAISTLSNIVFCTMAGYAFARYQFRGKTILFGIVLLTTIVPQDYSIIPLFLLINVTHLSNTYLGIALPNLVTPFGIFLIGQFARDIPREFIEAARIDGCTEYGILFRIAMPLLRAAITVLAIFSFFASWDNFFWPLIAATRKAFYTIPIGLASLTSDTNYNPPVVMAGIVLSLVPILLLFFIFQRQIMESNIGSGIKG